MECNVGPNERVVRLAIGVAAGVAAVALPRAGWWRIPLGLAAFAGLSTGLTRYCPMNAMLGIDNYTEWRYRQLPRAGLGEPESSPRSERYVSV